MQVKAIYEDGTINFAQPLKFKHHKFEVMVSIPEEELEAAVQNAKASTDHLSPTPPATDAPMSIGKRLDAILGPYKDQLKSGGAMTAQDYKNIWHEHLEEKYLGNK